IDKNVLRVTDIEHIHLSLSETDVPKSVVLDDKPMSLAAAVELLIIGAHYPALDGANSSVYSTVRATNWPVAGGVGSTKKDNLVVIVLPNADESSWWNEQLRVLKNELTANHFPPTLA